MHDEEMPGQDAGSSPARERRLLITGASRGIGRATALRMASPGTRLALCGSSHMDELAETVRLAEARGASCLALRGDLTDPAVPAGLVGRAADAFGGLDGVVSNAGMSRPASLTALELEVWDRLFAVNVRAGWLLAKHAYSALCAGRGSLVMVASMSGLQPYPGMGAYSPSKAALIMLARQLAQEWAAEGIRVNVVAPGLIRTPLTAAVYADPGRTRAREALVPMHRIGDPAADVAGVIAFLLGPEAGYITGQTLLADGGLLDSLQGRIAGRPGTGEA